MNPAEQYILNQEEPFRSILLQIQVIVENTVPELALKYKYRIPFYYIKNKPFCYLNASTKKQYVDIGFWKGNEIKIHEDYLVTEKRKMMVSLRYFKLEEIDDLVLREVLLKAANLYE